MLQITHIAAALWDSFTLIARTNVRVLRHMAQNWRVELAYLAGIYAVAALLFDLPPLA